MSRAPIGSGTLVGMDGPPTTCRAGKLVWATLPSRNDTNRCGATLLATCGLWELGAMPPATNDQLVLGVMPLAMSSCHCWWGSCRGSGPGKLGPASLALGLRSDASLPAPGCKQSLGSPISHDREGSKPVIRGN